MTNTTKYIFVGAAFVAVTALGAYDASQVAPVIPITSAAPIDPQPVAPPAKPTLPIDRWSVSVTENELDHIRTARLNNGELYLKCLPRLDNTEAYITPPLTNLGHQLQLDSSHMQRVRFRIDNGQIREEWWAVSDDFSALFLPTATLAEILQGAKLVVEYQPEYVERETTTIDLSGLLDALKSAGCE